MKILKFLTFILFVGVFLVLSKDSALALNPYRKLCVGIQGKFSANSSWHGGNIQIGCGGDNGLAVPEARRSSEACIGEVQTIRPGQTFRLTKCSCFGSDKGCIKVGKNLNLGPLVDGKRKIIVVKSLKESEAFTARSCKVTDLSNKCGSNGKQITANIKITCNAASPTPKPSASPTPTISGAPSPSICPKPGKVTNVKITCPTCAAKSSQQDN